VFGKKNIYKLFFIRAESSHELSRPQLKLGSFNYRARLARVIFARAILARVILARARLARARAEPRARAFLCSPRLVDVFFGSNTLLDAI
jgi:hypothetical protein